MRLTYNRMNVCFEFLSTALNSLVIEDSGIFMDFTMDLVEHIVKKEKEEFLLCHDDKTVELNKWAEVITSPLELVYDRRGLQKKLYEAVLDTMRISGADAEISELLGKMAEILENTCLETEYELALSEELGVDDVLKLFNIEFKTPSGSFAQRFMEYALTVKRFTSKTLFFLVNCDAYLNDEDYEFIEKWAESYEIYVVFIENTQIRSKIDYNEYIVDKDLCILH